MSGALTKGNENFNHRFHRFTQIFLFSAFSASLRNRSAFRRFVPVVNIVAETFGRFFSPEGLNAYVSAVRYFRRVPRESTAH